MRKIHAIVDVTIRKIVHMDMDHTENELPSRIAQRIQESILEQDERALEFHSVRWALRDHEEV